MEGAFRVSLNDWFDRRLFELVHRHNLVYNTCWEDPRLDRVALDLGPDDTLLVVTSAGCNVLDYALTGPRRIHAVDMNPRQNALLELKLAAITRPASTASTPDRRKTTTRSGRACSRAARRSC